MTLCSTYVLGVLKIDEKADYEKIYKLLHFTEPESDGDSLPICLMCKCLLKECRECGDYHCCYYFYNVE